MGSEFQQIELPIFPAFAMLSYTNFSSAVILELLGKKARSNNEKIRVDERNKVWCGKEC
jgi:hypothetical protein